MTKGLIDPQRGLNVNEFDEEAMSIEPGQFPDPFREFRILLFQVRRVLVRLSLVELLVKAHFTEEDLTMSSVIIMGNDISNNFQTYGSHRFPLFLYKKA